MKPYRVTFGTRDESGEFTPFADDTHDVEAANPRAAIDTVTEDRCQPASSIDQVRPFQWLARFDSADDLALIEEI